MNSINTLIPNWNEIESMEFNEKALEYKVSNGYNTEPTQVTVPKAFQDYAESSGVNLDPAVKIEDIETPKPPEAKPKIVAIPEVFQEAFKLASDSVLDPTKDVLKEAPGAIGELIIKDMFGIENKPKTPLKNGQTEVDFKDDNKKIVEVQFISQRNQQLEWEIREVIQQTEQKEDARLGVAGMPLAERVVRAGVQAGLQTVESVRNRYTRIFTQTRERWTATKKARQQSPLQVWAGKNGPGGNMLKLNAQEGNSMVANAVMTAG